MSVFDLFSKRQKRLRGEVPDVYRYDVLPQPLRVQIVHIVLDGLGRYREYGNNHGIAQSYRSLKEILCREYGLFQLGNEDDTQTQVINFFLRTDETAKALDFIELAFQLINSLPETGIWDYGDQIQGPPGPAIEELNARFREHGIGYRFERGQLVRIDSEIVHAEVVKPALSLLSEPRYSGAQEEFLKAHEHYRHGRAKEALSECLKALESTMKIIAAKRRWQVDARATASQLIAVMFAQGLIPDYWGQAWGGLRSILENGVPTARNRVGGHGQGAQPVSVPEHLVSFVLHQTAAAIVFLASAEKALP